MRASGARGAPRICSEVGRASGARRAPGICSELGRAQGASETRRASRICAFFFRGSCGGIVVHLFSMVSFFASTCPIRSGVGVIDTPDPFEHVLYPYYILEVREKNFSNEILTVRPQKLP